MSEIPSLDTFLKIGKTYDPPETIVKNAYIKDYASVYERSVKGPEGFWAEIASELSWYKPWEKVLEWKYPYARWFLGGQCNIVQNALDVHVAGARRNKVAFFWEGEPGDSRVLTYGQIGREVAKAANALKSLGVKKGDRVAIYMPRVPEQVISMLAAAKIGAIHTVIYSGFSSSALRERIVDAEVKLLITADGAFYRGKKVPLSETVNQLQDISTLKDVLMVRRVGLPVKENPSFRYSYWDELIPAQSATCETERMDSEDPLYFLYTSGTTGKPKGVVHVHGGYMVGVYITMKWIFDVKDEDIFWCTADPGWVTGHSYIVYGPLINGATSVLYEGAPDYPDQGRWWSICQKYGVTILYTTPTAVRALMRYGDSYPNKYDLSSLRLLGSVGEPINPEAWLWFYRTIGKSRCPIMDTWWQTETGMVMITPLPVTRLKPGSATKPFPGVEADVVGPDGKPAPPGKGGMLVIKNPWPAMMRTIYKNPERYEAYWNVIKDCYLAGDVASKDEDGYFWIKGRADDVIKTSGYRLGTAEIESALVSHPAVGEAAAIGKPDQLKGEVIKAFVTLKVGYDPSDTLIKSLKDHVRKELGPIAVPAEIEFVASLPKTRSGKIMRRLLKARELGLPLGDTSTLEE